MRIFVAALAASFLTTAIHAREKIQPIAVGDSIPIFEKLPSASGKEISLKDFPQEVLVVVVTCNECPVARAYEQRFVDFAKTRCGPDGKVAFLAVNPYDREGDTLADMKKRVEESKLPFEYVQDKDHLFTKKLGAEKTPHVFVFDKDRKLVYKGAFDDSWLDPSTVKKHYLADVVDAVLSGKKVPTVTKPEGCPIHID